MGGAYLRFLARTCVREAFRLGLFPSSSAGSLIRGITSVEDRVAAVTTASPSCPNEEDGACFAWKRIAG